MENGIVYIPFVSVEQPVVVVEMYPVCTATVFSFLQNPGVGLVAFLLLSSATGEGIKSSILKLIELIGDLPHYSGYLCILVKISNWSTPTSIEHYVTINKLC